jgi:hypothetical protein
MGKQLRYLKKGDKIWFVKNYHNEYTGLTSTPPKIYEAVIDADSSQQGTLPFPLYCYVHYYCPELNPYHLTSSENGTNEQGHNGHLFFTDYDECIDYVKDLAKKRLEYAEKRLMSLNKEINELNDILKA